MNKNYLEVLKFLIGIIFIVIVIKENFVIKSDSFFPHYFLYGMFLLYAVVFYLSITSNKWSL